VSALAQSPLQTQLIASGAAASEVYLWDVNKPTTPMAIGPKQQVGCGFCDLFFVRRFSTT